MVAKLVEPLLEIRRGLFPHPIHHGFVEPVRILSANQNANLKSIFLDAVSRLAEGKGKLPLRDGRKKGEVEGFGAHITIGRSTRHSGEFEILNLEGRFNLSELVDPKLKSPEACDRARIKALLRLNNTLMGRLITGPALMIGGFISDDMSKIANGNVAVIEAWLLHAAGLAGVTVHVEREGRRGCGDSDVVLRHEQDVGVHTGSRRSNLEVIA